MPRTSPGEALRTARQALRAVTLVQWVLSTMLAVGSLAFVRAFAGGEGVAVQRLAWGGLAWTFPLLWDLTAVIGSTLWISAPRATAAFRWGVALNLAATTISGLATGSQAYTLARDQTPQGWPIPSFAAGFAVPVLYSILTWAAASAGDALTRRENPWNRHTPSTATAEATDAASSAIAANESAAIPSTATPPLDPPRPTSAPPPAPSTPTTTEETSLERPAARWADDSTSSPPSTTPSTTTPTAGPETPTPPAAGGASPPDGSSPTAASTGPTTSPDDEPLASTSTSPSATDLAQSASTPAEREEWTVAELYRRAEAPNAPALRPRDVHEAFPGVKDGWRILQRAQARVESERAAAAGVGS